MIVIRIISPGSKVVQEFEVMPSDRLGFIPGTTLLAPEHWDLVKDGLASGGIKPNAL